MSASIYEEIWASERLAFRLDHHLGGDPEALRVSQARLQRVIGDHPLVMNRRAFHALPETALPPAGPELEPVAASFLREGPAAALELAQAIDAPSPRALVSQGDLLVAVGEIARAREVFEHARGALGPLPPLGMRLARCALSDGELAQALTLCAEALTENPAYGSAWQVLREAHAARGLRAPKLPLQTPVRRIEGRLALDAKLSSRARAAWIAWAQSANGDSHGASPPLLPAYTALVERWRQPTGEVDSYKERPSPDLELLDRWERAGVLGVFLWCGFLTRDNADGWRHWSAAHPDLSSRFWLEEVVSRPAA